METEHVSTSKITTENAKAAAVGALTGGLITLLITKGKAMWNYMTSPADEEVEETKEAKEETK